MDKGDGPAGIFYGLQVPSGVGIPEGVIVEPYYVDRMEVLKVLKMIKPARMKQFSTSEDAALFNATQPSTPIVQPGTPTNNVASAEALPYSSLRIQELTKLRQAIERGDVEAIHNLVDSNPRYLIASGDTPTMLQERCRYNALHSAAMKGQVAAAEIILNYLSQPELFRKLYPADTPQCRRNRMVFLMDLYLNTPDKGCNETPLHFAAKFGHRDVVKLLANEVSMDRHRVNRDGLTAAQVACSRVSNTNKQEILNVLEGQYYIPLYRSEDGVAMPFVGEPWNPGMPRSPEPHTPPCNGESDDMICLTSPLRSVHQHLLPQISAPSYSNNTFAHDMAVKAIVGPMSPKQAKEFKRNWSSPRRGYCNQRESHRARTDIVRSDPYKGLELVGRSLASEMEVPWTEYWDFLGCSVDIRENEGLQKLENFLRLIESNIEDSTNQENADQSNNNLSRHTPTSLPPASDIGQGDLNTTGESLCKKFSRMTIHSPSSPLWGPQNNGTTSPVTVDCSSHGGHSMCEKRSPAPHRTLLEYMVPNIIPFMDRLRSFWPFHRGDISHQPPSNDIQSVHTLSDSETSITAQVYSKPTAQTSESNHPTQTSQSNHPAQTSEGMVQCYEPKRVFLKGMEPCKVDTDVLKALQSVDIDETEYPAIHHWHNNVTSFTVQDRNSWHSPLALKHHERLRHLREKDIAKRRLVL